MPKLDETKNIVRLFCHLLEGSNAPMEWRQWAAISMVAASVSDRVWVAGGSDRPITPNLYVILIGPSGVGKNETTSMVLNILREIPEVDTYHGRLTGAYLIDYMSAGSRDDGTTRMAHTKPYLVTPELAWSIGRGDLARDLLTILTELYSSGGHRIQEGTRTHGGVELTDVCVNWFAGTTVEWLRECVDETMVEGGAFARMIPIVPAEIPERPIIWRQKPDDYEKVRAHVIGRVRALTTLEGPLTVEPESRSILLNWHETRPIPSEELLKPTWRRQHITAIKLAIIHSLADGFNMVVRPHHMRIGIKLTELIMETLWTTLRSASLTEANKHQRAIEDILSKQKEIAHSKLLKAANGRVGTTAAMFKTILETLRQAGRVERVRTATGGSAYKWIE